MRKILRLLLLSIVALFLVACGAETTSTDETSAIDTSEVESEEGPLLVGMEAAYPPYNWTQSDDSNDAVAIQNSQDYANGYDT